MEKFCWKFWNRDMKVSSWMLRAVPQRAPRALSGPITKSEKLWSQAEIFIISLLWRFRWGWIRQVIKNRQFYRYQQAKGWTFFYFFVMRFVKQRKTSPLKTTTTIKMKFNIATLVATACASPLTDRETVISPVLPNVEVRNWINIVKTNNI